MFTQQEVLSLCKGAKILGKNKATIRGISTDSRTVKRGELFIPLKGKKFDGRKFIPAVLKKGALVLDVKDSLTALQTLAAYHRNKFNIPIIGVTGSSGKTTTKEMIASILSLEMPVLKNELNYNNEIGVPLTLLKLTKKHRAAIIEMGMQGLGEIELLAKLVRPTIAVVTNIGEAHLQQLKTRKNIARAKAEIFHFLGKNDTAVINQDDECYENLKSKIKKSNIMTFGIIEKADVTTKELTGIKLMVPGEHMIYDALAAVAVAKILGTKKASIKKGLERYLPLKDRMHAINRRDCVKIINDTYNANPQSMAAALKVLSEISSVCQPGKTPHFRRIAVLGDMLELGKSSRSAHKKIVSLAQQLKIDKVYTFGQYWPKKAQPFSSKQLLIKELSSYLHPFDIVLVKGSRGMKMEEVVEKIKFS